MKNSSAFENTPNSGGGGGQTHVFTSFPDTHLDDEADPNFMSGADANKQASQHLLSENFLAEDAQTPVYSVWQIEYYQKFFNVSTNDVMGRVVGSMVPTFNQSFLLNRIRPNPDLYGPFWICVTLMFTISISGNIYSYLSSFGSIESWQTDFHKLTSSAFIIIMYWWIMSTFIYIGMRWRGLVADFQFVEILSVYGYSLFVFIPVSILWLIHISFIQWTLVIMAIGLSGSVLHFTFWPIFAQDSNQKVSFVILIIVFLMHSLLGIGFMVYFFHSPDHFDPVTTTTAKATLTAIVGNSTKSG